MTSAKKKQAPEGIKVTFILRDDQIAELKRISEETYVPVSAIIRTAVDKYLKEREDKP